MTVTISKIKRSLSGSKLNPGYLLYLIATALAIAFGFYIQKLVHGLGALVDILCFYANLWLSRFGFNIKLDLILALSLSPLIIITPIALIYRALCKRPLPYLNHISWMLWILSTLSFILSQEGLSA